MLRVFPMKWCLNGQFDLTNVILAISGNTLHPTGKSAANSRSTGRSRKREDISLKRNRKDTPTNDESFYDFKESNNTEDLLRNKMRKNKNHG